LSKDYEQPFENSQGMVFLASIHHLLKRLALHTDFQTVSWPGWAKALL
jgi:hypothetical protein